MKKDNVEYIVNGKNIKQWIEQETKEITVSFWGAETTFFPVLCEPIFGDGLQLVYFGTIDQRPYYWLLLIDSKTDIMSDDFDIETLLEPLEECFGKSPHDYITQEQFEKERENNFELQEYENYEEFESNFEYPMVWYSGGHYGLIVNMVTGEVG